MSKAARYVLVPFEPWHAPAVPQVMTPWSLSWTYWDTQEDLPLISGGFAAPWAGLAQVWLVLPPKSLGHGVVIARFVRRLIEREWASGQWRRLESMVRADDAVSRRWMAWLGFLPVTYKRNYGPRGEDYWEYVYVGRGQHGRDE